MTRDQARTYLGAQGLLDHLCGGVAGQLEPDYRDLARLHVAATSRKAFTVLEFGVGWSTVVLADAMRVNRHAWERLRAKPRIRNQHPFKIFSIDSSLRWIKAARRLIPKHLREHVRMSYSRAACGTFNGRICHFYEALPDVNPDFIYLDGPDPATVRGHLSGMTWTTPDRPVVSGDLLLMEPTLLPGTFVVVDGRTTNVRFLQNNLQRRWRIRHDGAADVTTLELVEPPLGPINRETLAYCLGKRSPVRGTRFRGP
jgi:hypothetical protein